MNLTKNQLPAGNSLPYMNCVSAYEPFSANGSHLCYKETQNSSSPNIECKSINWCTNVYYLMVWKDKIVYQLFVDIQKVYTVQNCVVLRHYMDMKSDECSVNMTLKSAQFPAKYTRIIVNEVLICRKWKSLPLTWTERVHSQMKFWPNFPKMDLLQKVFYLSMMYLIYGKFISWIFLDKSI